MTALSKKQPLMLILGGEANFKLTLGTCLAHNPIKHEDGGANGKEVDKRFTKKLHCRAFQVQRSGFRGSKMDSYPLALNGER